MRVLQPVVTIRPINTSTKGLHRRLSGSQASIASHPSAPHFLHMHQIRLPCIPAHSTPTAPRHRACTAHRRLIDRSASTQQNSCALHMTILAGDIQRRCTVRLKHHMAYTVHIISPCLPFTPRQRACYSRRSRYSCLTKQRACTWHGLSHLSCVTSQNTRQSAHARSHALAPRHAVPSSLHSPPSPG